MEEPKTFSSIIPQRCQIMIVGPDDEFIAMQCGRVAKCGSLGAEVIDILSEPFTISNKITPDTIHEYAEIKS